MTLKVLRLPCVTERTGLARSTIYQLVKDGQFPAPVKLSARAVGWLEDDIVLWLESRKTVATSSTMGDL